MLCLTVSADHELVDGAPVARSCGTCERSSKPPTLSPVSSRRERRAENKAHAAGSDGRLGPMPARALPADEVLAGVESGGIYRGSSTSFQALSDTDDYQILCAIAARPAVGLSIATG